MLDEDKIMIKPNLKDWWTRKQLTEFRYNLSAFSSSGVPASVILKSFEPLKWNSTVYGEQCDNLVLIAFKDGKHSNLKQQSKGSANYDLPAGEKIEEYILDESLQKLIGWHVKNDDSYEIKNYDEILYLVYFHDNCFCHIEPIDRNLVLSLLRCILEQHSYYLNLEVDWKNCNEVLLNISKDGKPILLKTHTREKRVSIRYSEGHNLLRKIFSRRVKKYFVIKNGIAHYEQK